MPINVNYFGMKVKMQNKLYLYRIEFGSNVDTSNHKEMRKAFKSASPDIERIYGNLLSQEQNILLCKNFVEGENEFTGVIGSETTALKIVYKMTIDLDELTSEARLELPKVLLIFNNIVKKALNQNEYKQIGRFPKFFRADDKININQHQLQAWPGYELSCKLTMQGVYLNIESCTKFVNQRSILDIFND